jgi:hypothetical protein
MIAAKIVRLRHALAATAKGGLCRDAGIVLAAFLLTVSAALPSRAEDPRIAKNRASERKIFTDREITDGFFKVAFGAEFSVAGRTNRIRKYDGPVRVYVDSRAKPDRRAQVAAVVADIRAHVNHLDIAVVDSRDSANVIVTLVRDRELVATIRKFFGRAKAQRIQRSLGPQCLSGFSKDGGYRITHSEVIVVADSGDFIFFDCIYEEMLQALGPINDTAAIPWTMFNDNVQKGFFDLYDQYLLNILYDSRIRPGMTRATVRALLPQVLPAVRNWVGRVNDLKP